MSSNSSQQDVISPTKLPSPKQSKKKRKASDKTHNDTSIPMETLLTTIPPGSNAILTESEVKQVQSLSSLPICWFLDYSGSMGTDFKMKALKHVLEVIGQYDEKQQPYSVTKISSEPCHKLRLALHQKQELDDLKSETPLGGTYLWQCIATNLLHYSSLGLGEINAAVLTDGADNESTGSWHGIHGAVELMRLARHLGTSLTISFIQLGGDSKEQENLRAVAGITGGAFLHLKIDQIDLSKEEDIVKMHDILQQIDVFGLEVQTQLTKRENRNKVLHQRKSEACLRFSSVGKNKQYNFIDPSILNSADYAALCWSAKLQSVMKEEKDKIIAKALLQVLMKMVLDGETSIHARVLRARVYTSLPKEIQSQFSASQIANVYNSQFLISSALVGEWLERSKQDEAVWILKPNADEVLVLSFRHLFPEDNFNDFLFAKPILSSSPESCLLAIS
jgi:hypothetical protein